MAIAAKYANVCVRINSSLEARFKEISNRKHGNSNDRIIRPIELDVVITKSESELEYKKNYS